MKKLHAVPGIIAVASALVASVSSAFAAPNKLPVVNTFTLAASASSPIPVLAFAATDSDGTVVGYLCNDTSTKPLATDPHWTAVAPATCSTTKSGSVIMYGWAKDDAGGVSAGKTFTTLVPGTPAHVIADVQGLQIVLDGKAAIAHDHDDAYQKKYANVVVVAKSGGDFTDPIAAINSITNASEMNPYLLKIMPGVYDLGSGTLTMKEYVDIEGSGENTTHISSVVSSGSYPPETGTVRGASNAEIRLLSITNDAEGLYGIAFVNVGASPYITHVTASALGSGGDCYGIFNSSSSWPVLRHVTANASGGFAMNVGINNSYNSYPGIALTDVTVNAIGGQVAVGILNSSSYSMMNNIVAYASGATTDNAGIRNMYSSTFIKNATLTAEGGNSATSGIGVFYGTIELTNVMIRAEYGTANYGMIFSRGRGTLRNVSARASDWGMVAYIDTGSTGQISIDGSSIEGNQGSISSQSGLNVRVGATKLAGSVNGGGTYTCVASYNGDYAPLDAACQ